MPRVEKYMRTDFKRVTETSEVLEALKLMGEEGLSFLVVVRGTFQIAGIITRTDLIKLRGSIVLKEGLVRDVIGDQLLIALSPQDFIQDALGRFERNPHIDQIVVVDLLQPVGILSRSDVINWMYEEEFLNLQPD